MVDAPPGTAPPPAGAMPPPVAVATRLHQAVCTTVRGKPDQVRLALAAVLSGGHLLVSDLPGTGKTLLAKSLARAIGGRFRRVQCTPDLLPTDITGTSIFHPDSGRWEFREGPLFANVVLVDEINRASPRTQAALLEPMEERQVTVDGATRPLPDPFVCVATQNPHGQVGTFPLPESQLDRFGVVLALGLPDRSAERDIVTGTGGVSRLDDVPTVTSPAEIAAVIASVTTVHCAPPLVEYLLELIDATRRHPYLTVGASPRASTGLLSLARAHAVVAGREFVLPDDVQAVLVPGLAHRVSVGGRVDLGAAGQILADIVTRTPVPRG